MFRIGLVTLDVVGSLRDFMRGGKNKYFQDGL
jgi:hypothetical protein